MLPCLPGTWRALPAAHSAPHQPALQSGYKGVGPVCWEECTSPDAVDGGALCCASKGDCTSKILGLCAGLPIAVMEALLSGGNATKIMHAAEQAIDAVLGFVMPLCSAL